MFDLQVDVFLLFSDVLSVEIDIVFYRFIIMITLKFKFQSNTSDID
jgi:hypothetical protein